MGNTEYFEMCEITVEYNAQIVHLIGKRALYVVRAADACSLRKEIDN